MYITSNFYDLHNPFFNKNGSNATVLMQITEKIQIYLKNRPKLSKIYKIMQLTAIHNALVV